MSGDFVMIKNGIAITIDDDGNTSISKADTCDICFKAVSVLGSRTVRDHTGEAIQFQCASCRA